MVGRIIFFLACFAFGSIEGQNLSSLEYFIDVDPGAGNGVILPIQGPDTSQLDFVVNTSMVSMGLHTLRTRVLDDSNRVSLTSSMNFIKVGDVGDNIQSVEYFVDVDPGFGSGVVVSNQSTSDTSLSFSVNTQLLATGLHSLHVRCLDDLGQWSITDVFYFVKYASGLPDLTIGEYYFDQDPGFGQATTFAISGSDVSGHILPITFSSLSPGLHQLFIRVKNESTWSLTNKISFVKVSTKDLAFKKGEYFIDNDPGFGNGIAFAEGSSSPSSINLPINTSALSLGAHTLFVRSEDSCGHWSITSSIDFFKIFVQNEFNQLEYYFDDDPGFGEGISLSIMGLDTSNVIIQPDITGLENGLHTMSIRSRSLNGAWSLTSTIIFFKYISPILGLTRGEYFFNTTVPVGTGTPFSLAGGLDMSFSTSLDISSLPSGINYFFYRTLDQNGVWSQVSIHPFVKYAQELPSLVRLEYFINDDPGFGSAIPINLPMVSDTHDFELLVETSHLEADYHTLFVRAYDTHGQWSITESIDFVKYCLDSLALIDVFVPDSFYQAAANIRSNGTMNPVVTTFKSMEIDLLPGFEVPLGVQFVTESGDCPVDPGASESVSKSPEKGPIILACTCLSSPCVCAEKTEPKAVFKK